MRRCKCGALMLWRWGYCSWKWICPQCGHTEYEKMLEVEDG